MPATIAAPITQGTALRQRRFGRGARARAGGGEGGLAEVAGREIAGAVCSDVVNAG